MDQWLEDLGAHRVLPLALGDEDSLDEDFNNWAELVMRQTVSGFSIPKVVSS